MANADKSDKKSPVLTINEKGVFSIHVTEGDLPIQDIKVHQDITLAKAGYTQVTVDMLVKTNIPAKIHGKVLMEELKEHNKKVKHENT